MGTAAGHGPAGGGGGPRSAGRSVGVGWPPAHRALLVVTTAAAVVAGLVALTGGGPDALAVLVLGAVVAAWLTVATTTGLGL